MKISHLVCAALVAGAFAGPAGAAQTIKLPAGGIQAVQPSDITLADQVNALKAQVAQLNAQLQALQSQLAQTTKTANDADFKAGLANNWINANGDKLAKSSTGGGENGAVGALGNTAAGAAGNASGKNGQPGNSSDQPQKSATADPGSTYAAGNVFTTPCNVADVHAYPDRIHIRCKQPVSGKIFYFAAETGNQAAIELQVFNAIQVTGLVNRTVTVSYDPSPNANPPGCQVADCRRLLKTQ